jgi:hypothetical protein
MNQTNACFVASCILYQCRCRRRRRRHYRRVRVPYGFWRRHFTCSTRDTYQHQQSTHEESPHLASLLRKSPCAELSIFSILTFHCILSTYNNLYCLPALFVEFIVQPHSTPERTRSVLPSAFALQQIHSGPVRFIARRNLEANKSSKFAASTPYGCLPL